MFFVLLYFEFVNLFMIFLFSIFYQIFEAGDKVRDEVLESAGVRIRDTHEGSHWVFEKEK